MKLAANFLFLIFTGLFWGTVVCAKEYQLPNNNQRLIGDLQYHQIKKGDYFQNIAEIYDVGFLALLSANPGIDPFLPEIGTEIVIPTAMLLPYVKREGIVINLSELRLYYFLPEQNKVHVFPVGIGRQGLETPKMVSYIGDKRENPEWRPTQNMRKRYLAEHGKELARIIPAGPDNPFGKYALRIGFSEYLIHGSNQRFGIGMRASSGCLRLYDNDIKWLYDNVPVRTPVRIIDQPIKMSYENNTTRLIEIHAPLTKEGTVKETVVITDAVKKFVGKNQAHWQHLAPIIEQPKGLIVELTN